MTKGLQLRYGIRSFMEFATGLRLPTYLTGSGMRLSLFAAVIVLSLGYFMQISRLSTSGYQIAALEKNIAGLNDETQKLNTEVASYQSIASVEKRLGAVSMVPAGQIRIVKTGVETAMAP